MRYLAMTALTLGLFGLAGTAMAQERQVPQLPEPLQNLAAEGAQMRYLGREGGLDGWIAVRAGQEQYFYVTPDRSSFVMGLQFDGNGRIITLQQVQKLQQESGDDVLDFLASGLQAELEGTAQPDPQNVDRAFKTPSEQLFEDIEGSNWISIGQADAPAIYTFIDPQCPYCKSFLEDLRRDYLPNGLVQVRIIPVGFREDTMAQSAFLLAAPNPQERLYRFMDGDNDALPVSRNVNQQGVQRNLAVMQSWKLNVTPLTVYRARDGQVKIVQGRASDLASLIRDIGS